MLVVNLILVATLFFGAILFVSKRVIFSATDKDLHRLHNERVLTQKKQEELQDKMKECDAECAKHIEETKKEAARLKKEALDEAANQAKEIIAAAREEGEGITQKGTDSLERLKKNLIAELDVKAMTFANQIFERIFSEGVRGKVNIAFSDDFIDRFEEIDVTNLGAVKEIEIVSAEELPEDVYKKAKENLEKKTGNEITVKKSVDAALLAGVIFKCGTLMLDGSLLNRIKEVGEQMKLEAETD